VGCKGNVVGKAAAEMMGMGISLRGEGDGLLGGVGSIEATVIIMLNFAVEDLAGVRSFR
jgi:hypothetical protein